MLVSSALASAAVISHIQTGIKNKPRIIAGRPQSCSISGFREKNCGKVNEVFLQVAVSDQRCGDRSPNTFVLEVGADNKSRTTEKNLQIYDSNGKLLFIYTMGKWKVFNLGDLWVCSTTKGGSVTVSDAPIANSNSSWLSYSKALLKRKLSPSTLWAQP